VIKRLVTAVAGLSLLEVVVDNRSIAYTHTWKGLETYLQEEESMGAGKGAQIRVVVISSSGGGDRGLYHKRRNSELWWWLVGKVAEVVVDGGYIMHVAISPPKEKVFQSRV